jgi:hypothetical protein
MHEASPINAAWIYSLFGLAMSGPPLSLLVSDGRRGLLFLDLADTARQFVGLTYKLCSRSGLSFPR